MAKSAQAATGRINRNIILYLAMLIMVNTGFGLIEADFNLYILSMGISPEFLGVILSLTPFTQALAAIPLGFLAEKATIADLRRLRDELNFETSLEHVYYFCYEASFGAAGSENELCHVFLGKTTNNVRPNDSEIAGIRYISAAALEQEFDMCPEQFTPWFKQEWRELQLNYSEQLGRYCGIA